ncbi:MAG: HAD family hydrolase, partial [Planctomycetes bacterium]|nr:HAD family hydrolase [Planctomycetota bacterium]
ALCLGAGIPAAETAEFANLAAGVTVQKLFCTGTACASEILTVGKDTDYIYQPELAEDSRQARRLPDTDIELCYPSITTGRIQHVVFDNDGTISTLRQGWEAIMVPMMMKAVLGDQYDTADETLYHKVRSRVLDYIDKSTGIQTILQMEALVDMVTEFGIVPRDQILDRVGYKEIYNRSLLDVVDQRISKLTKRVLDISDYTVKGAVQCLQTLRDRGMTLYLASGTDHQDVVDEAKALGYSDLFDGGIYGALGDVTKYSKKMVIERIISENSLQGPELAVFGDGPVEIREVRKRHGVAIGIASDEVQRHGWNGDKRTRLIKAGAHVVCPDFSEYEALLAFLLS